MAEEIFEALVEKPINGPREIPPGRTPLGPTGPEEVDNLPQPTPEEEQQADQGEALIRAVEKYGKMGDPHMNPQGLMKMASSVLKGGYPEGRVENKMGIPMLPEVGGTNGELA